MTDSGCQTLIMGLDDLYQLGFKRKDLVRISATATSISGQQIEIVGIVVLRFSGMDKVSGKMAEMAAQVRVAKDVRDIYISKQMMHDLGIISKDFPSVRVAGERGTAAMAACGAPAGDRVPCGCPRCSGPPPVPEVLPLETVEESCRAARN